MSNLRTNGKSAIVWVILGLLILSLGGFGVTSFSGSSSELGHVGQTSVDTAEYQRALRRRMDAAAASLGRAMTMAEGRQLGLPETTLAELFTRATLTEEARRLGVSVGDAEVARQIAEIPAFQSGGQFNRASYADLLGRQRMTESEFEAEMRADAASQLVLDAVAGGVTAPKPALRQISQWLLEGRDFSWARLSEADLSAPIEAPDDETLAAWRDANAARFQTPEMRRISYAWANPETLAPDMPLDEDALRTAYQDRLSEFQQPEQRLVSRLVYPDAESAQAAAARLQSGADFETLAHEQGLSLSDIDLGAVTEASLGAAGPAVFALSDTGVVGPLESQFGPALYSVNAVLEPVNVTFEAARPQLALEAQLDRARRAIAEQSGNLADLLAGGATLEELAADGDMMIGTVDFAPSIAAGPDSPAAYPEVARAASQIEADDFPELIELSDGGVIALRLDEIIAPTLPPLDEIRDEVARDWRRDETARRLLARAEEIQLGAMSQDMPQVITAPEDQAAGDAAKALAGPAGGWFEALGVTRDQTFGLPTASLPATELATRAFELAAPGDAAVVEAPQGIFVVRLTKIMPADPTSDVAIDLQDQLEGSRSASLQRDVMDYYVRAAQARAGVDVNRPVVAAVEAQFN